MEIKNFATNKIYLGNCLEKMKKLPSKSVDLIFADPPYNLQLKKDLKRPDYTNVNGVKENWDKFKNFEEYDDFTKKWIQHIHYIARDAVKKGLSPAEVLELGVPEFLSSTKLAKETWNRDVPILMKHYENDN